MVAINSLSPKVMVSHGSELGGPGGIHRKSQSLLREWVASLQGSMFNKFHVRDASKVTRVAAELPIRKTTSQSAQRSCSLPNLGFLQCALIPWPAPPAPAAPGGHARSIARSYRLELKVDDTRRSALWKFVGLFCALRLTFFSFGEWGFTRDTMGYPVLVKIDGDGRDSNFGRFLLLFRFQSHGTSGKLSTTVTIGQDEYVRTKPLGSKKCGLNVMVCWRSGFTDSENSLYGGFATGDRHKKDGPALIWVRKLYSFHRFIPHGQSTWHSPKEVVGQYMAYINQYMVTVPSTFTLV